MSTAHSASLPVQHGLCNFSIGDVIEGVVGCPGVCFVVVSPCGSSALSFVLLCALNI